MTNKKHILIVLTIIFVGLFIIGATYAFWTWNSSTSKNVIFNTSNNIKEYIIYDEGDSKFSGNFEVVNSYNQGMHSTISMYKTTEVANIDLTGIIHMNIHNIGSNIKNSNALKWVVTEGTTENIVNVLSEGTFNNLNNGDTITLVPNITVTTTETFYTVWIWLDSSENPDSSLTGETLDVSIWTEFNQSEGLDDNIDITSLKTSYQNITATVLNSKNKITNYAITTEEIEPSTWTSIPVSEQNNIYNFSYNVDDTGTYYIWFKDSSGNTSHRVIAINNVDSTGPVCTFGNFSSSTIVSGEASTITLTCTDSESGISSNLTTSDITITGNSASITSFTKESITNGYIYTITLTSGSNDGDVILSLENNKVTNGGGLGNVSVSSSTLTVANPRTVTIYYNDNSTLGGTTINTFTDTCTFSSGATSCSITLPNSVINSVGTYNNAIVGFNTNTGTMTTTVPISTTISISEDTTYYAIYRTNVTNYYYDSSYTSRTLYRNQYFTSNSTLSNTVLSTSSTGTSNVGTAVGPGSSVWSGLSTAADTTAEYATVAEAVASDTTTLYTIYQFNITYAKSTNVSGVGSTSGSCKVTTSNTSCSVTLPTITPNTGYTAQGWYTSTGGGGTKAGNASASYTISNTGTTLYAYAKDTTAPTGSVSAILNGTTVNATVSARDTGSGLATSGTYGWKISSSSTCNSSVTGWTTNTNTSYNFTNQSGTSLYVCVRVADAASNYGYLSTKVIIKAYLKNMGDSSTAYKSSTYMDKIKKISFVTNTNNTGAVASWDLSENTDNKILGWILKNTSNQSNYDLYIGSNYAIYTKNLKNMFAQLQNVESVDMNNLHTEECTNMSYMLYDVGYYSNKFNLSLGNNFNTSNVTNMAYMFAYVGGNASNFNINLGNNFDTHNVTNMAYMFVRFGKNANDLNLHLGDKFDTHNVSNYFSMFEEFGQNVVKNFNVHLGNNFNASGNIGNMFYFFENAGRYADNFTLNLGSNFNLSGITNTANGTGRIFFGAGRNANNFYFDCGNNFNMSRSTDSGWFFSTQCSDTKKCYLDLGNNFNPRQMNDIKLMFSDVGANTQDLVIKLGNIFNTAAAVNMSQIFSGAGQNSTNFTLYLGNKFYTNNVTDIYYAFENVGKNSTNFNFIQNVPINTTKVIDGRSAFDGMGNKSTTNFILDLSAGNFTNITAYTDMLRNFGNTNTKIYVKDTTARQWIIDKNSAWRANFSASNVLIK